MKEIKFETNLKGVNHLVIEKYDGQSEIFLLSDEEAKDLVIQIVDKMELVI